MSLQSSTINYVFLWFLWFHLFYNLSNASVFLCVYIYTFEIFLNILWISSISVSSFPFKNIYLKLALWIIEYHWISFKEFVFAFFSFIFIANFWTFWETLFFFFNIYKIENFFCYIRNKRKNYINALFVSLSQFPWFHFIYIFICFFNQFSSSIK